MLKIILSGCNGKMGQMMTRICSEDDRVSIVAGFDVRAAKPADYPVYADPLEYGGYADVVVDFSIAPALAPLLAYCVRSGLPAVLCTTGYGEGDLKLIEEASGKIPVFRSANMSLGINVIADLLKKCARVLGDGFDVEIADRHHNRKIDTPSGTSLMLADAVASALPYKAQYTYDRSGVRRERAKNEIGITSMRCGTLYGEHSVVFAGHDEIIEIKHTVLSREVFAVGAIKAALFMAKVKSPGMYSMSDLISED